jgi:ABC-type multidrug transport system fused ATPase/permease subunit
MDLIEGSMDRPTTCNAFAIATQDAWLEQNTIKENILFGAPYDEERFEQVIEACALGLDLTRWEARENTEIGEKGISLSGGQRARVALARAIYSKAPYVLLDDPYVSHISILFKLTYHSPQSLSC